MDAVSRSDSWHALAHALGSTFIELQQLEFTVVSYLSRLAYEVGTTDKSFDVFASGTFGNLLQEMLKHYFLKRLVDKMTLVKEKRNFFIHRFLFQRCGGDLMTSEAEYEVLIRDAIDLGDLFSSSRTLFHDFMFQHAPLIPFAAKRDPESGKLYSSLQNFLENIAGEIAVPPFLIQGF